MSFSDISFLAYIDPGVTSLAIQAVFALMFGALATWLLAPWRFFASLFHRGKRKNAAESTDDLDTPTSVDERDDEPGEPPQRNDVAA
ncbi:MAG: hypothetical protein IH991_22715 [Planctomycetes bacterium]|nr:hypothetical protein [Planctomycetota bacterium]